MARFFPTEYPSLITREDAQRTQIANLAVRMQRFPAEVRAQSALDIWDMLGVFEDEAERNKPGT